MHVKSMGHWDIGDELPLYIRFLRDGGRDMQLDACTRPSRFCGPAERRGDDAVAAEHDDLVVEVALYAAAPRARELERRAVGLRRRPRRLKSQFDD